MPFFGYTYPKKAITNASAIHAKLGPPLLTRPLRRLARHPDVGRRRDHDHSLAGLGRLLGQNGPMSLAEHDHVIAVAEQRARCVADATCRRPR